MATQSVVCRVRGQFPTRTCRNKQSALHRLEFFQRPVAFFLRFVAVHGTRLEAVSTQRPGQHVAPLLRFDKNKTAIFRAPAFPQVAQQITIFFLVTAHLNHLRDIFVPRKVERSDSDLVVATEIVIRQRLHFFRPSGGPHQNLTIGANLRNNLAELRFNCEERK